MLKYVRTTYWITTGFLIALLSLSAATYFLNYDEVCLVFLALGFPTWLVYPLAIAKILAVLVILLKFNTSLVDWAYAGVFFNLLLAVGAHAANNDDQMFYAMVGLVLCLISYFSWKKLARSKEKET